MRNLCISSFGAALLCGSLAAGCAAPEDQVDGGPLTVSSSQCGDVRLGAQAAAIVNGDAAWDSNLVSLSAGQAKAVGAVMTRRGGPNATWSNTCTGTLVAPSVVVTAAHCVQRWNGDDMDPSRVGFVVGNDAATGHFLAVAEVVSHPDYNSQTGRRDLAVLVLESPAHEGVADIEPIAYNCSALSGSLVGQALQTVGFGCTDSECAAANTKRYWAVQDVIHVGSHLFSIDGYGVAGVCFGDSGGPALRTLPSGEVRTLGTLSWGDAECGNQDHYASINDSCAFLDGFVGGCGEVSAAGWCDGEIARYCDENKVVGVDCASTGKVCGDDGAGLLRCVQPDATPAKPSEQPCGEVTAEGYCDGDTAVWCADGQLQARHCDACGQSCQWTSEISGFYCR